MKHSARSTAKYLIENLPLQIVLVISLLALVLVFCIPFVAKGQETTDPQTDPQTDTDPWNPQVKVTFYGLGSLVRTTTDQNGREVFNVIQRRYNEILDGVDGSKRIFHTELPIVPRSEVLHKNGVRQVPGLNYIRVYQAGDMHTATVLAVSFLDGSVPQVLPDGSEDVLVIDYDPVQ